MQFWLGALVWAPVVSGQPATEARVAALRSAAALIEHHDYEKAERVLQICLSRAGDDALALNLLGVLRMQQQRPAEAEQLFLRAVETGRPAAGPHVNLAKLYAQGRPLESIAQIGEALKLAPDDAEAIELLRRITDLATTAAMRAKDAPTALAIATAACKVKPNDPELLFRFGMVAADGGLKAEAERALAEALSLKADFYDAEYALARVCLDENKAREAESLMRQYLEARPSDASAQYGLGYILVSEEKLDEAKAAFRRSIQLQPTQTESEFQLGSIAQQQDDIASAKRWFDEVLARDPRHAGALTGVAALEFRNGQYEDAQAKLQQAIALSPNYQKAHYYYALVLLKLGRKQEATREFEATRSLEKPRVSLAPLAQ